MSKEIKKTSIGGQAVIEGVMMRGPFSMAVAVRKPDGEIIIDEKPVNQKKKNFFLRLPIIRGAVNFFESLVLGTKTLMFSAEFFDVEEENQKESKFDKWLEKVFGDKLKDAVIYFSVILSLVFSVLMFMFLPVWVTNFFARYFGDSALLRTIIEGVIRMGIFLLYLFFVSKMEDIKRVFMYHGAEHKTIFCYENQEELTVENVKKYDRYHPRCGTSFLLIVMIISTIVFAFAGFGDNPILRTLIKLLLLPFIAGISYEIIKWAGRSECRLVSIINRPGMWLQKLTTREPDDSQIEVAIAALNAVITGNREDDKW